MHSHLVAVKVGIECRAHQGMQLDGLAFNQGRFEGLDAQTVKGGGTVQHHRMLPDDLVQNIPNFRAFAFHHLFGRFDRCGKPPELKFAEDERFEQFQSHFLGQTALVQLQGGSYDDHRTS